MLQFHFLCGTERCHYWKKNHFRMHPPQISILEDREVSGEASLPFADGLLSDMLHSSHSIIYYFSVKGK